MAGTKISELPVATTLTGAELVPVVQSGATDQTTVNAIALASLNYLVGSATAANIASVSASINTTDKFTGKFCWDTTNNRLMRANGSTANAVWYVVDGSTYVSPT